jgi:hypothetical protein
MIKNVGMGGFTINSFDFKNQKNNLASTMCLSLVKGGMGLV